MMSPETAQTSLIGSSPAHSQIQVARRELESQIIGQHALIDRLLIALLCDGHLLVEGAPGLAKTRAINVLASLIEGGFQRIQFTPDLLPADLTGTDIWQPESGDFIFKSGPLFNNIILADEINRASAKVQSALLEAMAERQITVGNKSHGLPALFMVMATQNPIEQEGTFPLPEAQLDRFLLHVSVDYPSADDELEILRLTHNEAEQALQSAEASVKEAVLTQADILNARQQVMNVHVSNSVERYIVELVVATRDPTHYDQELATFVEFGASPRATITLNRTVRAHAWLQGRDYVTPGDVQLLAHDVLRHRVLLSYKAQAQGIDVDQFVNRLLERVAVV